LSVSSSLTIYYLFLSETASLELTCSLLSYFYNFDKVSYIDPLKELLVVFFL